MERTIIYMIWESYDDGSTYEREMCYDCLKAEEGAFYNHDDALQRVLELVEWRKNNTHALPEEQVSVGVDEDDSDKYYVINGMDCWEYSVVTIELR